MRREIKLAFLIFCTGLIPVILSGQQKYWIHKKDTSFLSEIAPSFCSEWLPYCSYKLNSSQVYALGHTCEIERVVHFQPTISENSVIYGFALEQIEANLLTEKGLTGKGVKIGIIDGGFLNADKNITLTKHFKEKRVISYKDYITPDLPAYKGSKHLDDSHGADVWSLIGGYNVETNVKSGIATEAMYYLARTDHGGFEKRLEEDLLIQAIEDMHKQGIRIINVSLGYADGYTRKDQNYRPEQMDGKTTLLARAIDSAFFKKDLLIVVSAGNEGNRESWKVLSTPGDAQGALTVGASVLNGRSRMKYSSIGTPGIGYIKPEVVCFASNGTSFSAPVITGLAAAILQYDSTYSANDIKELIIQSSSLFPYGNNHLGYGIPKASVLLELLEGGATENQVILIETKKKRIRLKGIEQTKQVTTYHNNGEGEVVRASTRNLKRNSMTVKMPQGVSSSTVLTENKHFEITWTQ